MINISPSQSPEGQELCTYQHSLQSTTIQETASAIIIKNIRSDHCHNHYLQTIRKHTHKLGQITIKITNFKQFNTRTQQKRRER